MHGAPAFDPPQTLWWGRQDRAGASSGPASRAFPGAGRSARAAAGADEAHAAASAAGIRSIFQTSDPDHRFRADGLIDTKGNVQDREGLHRLMGLLAGCIAQASLNPSAIGDNPGLPSGYAYLLQFIAHDMTDSVATLAEEAGVVRPAILNQRQRSLMLDTLYGTGPESHAQAYAVAGPGVIIRGGVPRVYLRTGNRQTPSAGAKTRFCPYRDLVRANPPADDNAGPEISAHPTEAYVADRRNDSHSLISQLTVLFQLLHNSVVRGLEQALRRDGKLPDSQRLFLCARAIVTLIYREIIETDVLGRMLDDTVLQRYRDDDKVFFDGDAGVPIEFTHGAFRFAHAIVRDSYRIRSEEQESLLRALAFNSSSTPDLLPVTERWFVDWARFFDTPHGKAANLSKLIGPHYSRGLLSPLAFPAKSELDVPGLANRDFLSASYAGLLSAKALNDKMRSLFGEQLIRPFEAWKPLLRQWLTEKWPVAGGPAAPDLDRLANDPPLPFFVMFEAQHANQGKSLGPIGSIIVAEAVFGALRSTATGFESNSPLQQKIETCVSQIFPEHAGAAPIVAASIGQVSSMPELLAYLASM